MDSKTETACDYSIPDDLRAALGCEGGGTLSDASDVTLRIANSVILVLGIVAVIFVIKGGVDYMTSMGESSKLKRAKDTILYAVIGLVVCALAFAIVNFVIIDIIG